MLPMCSGVVLPTARTTHCVRSSPAFTVIGSKVTVNGCPFTLPLPVDVSEPVVAVVSPAPAEPVAPPLPVVPLDVPAEFTVLPQPQRAAAPASTAAAAKDRKDMPLPP